MMFTHLGRIVAILALVTAIFHVAIGLMFATGVAGPPEAVAMFFPSKKTTGAVIDRGLYVALFAIALGILTEISYSVRAQRET